MNHAIAEIDAAALAQELQQAKGSHAPQQGSSPVLVDVREAWEVELGALPHAVHAPMGSLAGPHPSLPQDLGTPLVTYCHHGVRSLRAAQLLQAQGYTQVRSLQGGIDAWSTAVDPSIGRY
jgi:rhodanese-related sulfurtransferase